MLLRGCRAAGTAADGDEPRAPFDVRIDRGRLVQVGSLQSGPSEEVVDLGGAYLVPGLVDAHVHLALGGSRDPVANARRALRRGVCAVRDLGRPEEEPGEAAEGNLSCPRIVSAGPALTRPGGYGLFLGRPIPPGSPLAPVVDGLISRGAGVIKVVLTGAVDLATGTVGPAQFSARELAQIVAAARGAGIPVAAHANGRTAVALAARAGVDSVEHGILLGSAELQLLAERGIRWVPTLSPLHALAADPRCTGLPRVFSKHLEAVAEGAALGVKVVAGTDAGSPGVQHGALGLELALLRRAGLSAEQLRASVTQEAARLLGLPEGYGTLDPGAQTDLVWFSHDPFAPEGPRRRDDPPDALGDPLGVLCRGRRLELV